MFRLLFAYGNWREGEGHAAEIGWQDMWSVSTSLPAPDCPGERVCEACRPRYRIYMNFMHRRGWHVSFLEHDARTPLALKLTFADPDKIRDMHKRYGSRIAEDVMAMEHGITNGRGGIWLMVEQAQYEVLKQGTQKAPPGRVG